MNGQGKYHDELEKVTNEIGATTAVLIVADGNRGPGFEVRGNIVLLSKLPSVLREVARKLEQDFNILKNQHLQ